MSELYKPIYDRVSNWVLEEADSTFIESLPFDLINRAQRTLNKMHNWDAMVTVSALTVTNDVADLPSDVLKLIAVYEDSTNDGKPDRYYYRNGQYSNGYKFSTTFDKDTGKTDHINFYSTPGTTTYIRYLKALPDFTNQTDTAQYSFFPEEMMFAQAKLLHLEDQEVIDGAYSTAQARLNTELVDFRKNNLNVNNEMYKEWRDYNGTEIWLDGYNPAGVETDTPRNDYYEKDYDRGRGWNGV